MSEARIQQFTKLARTELEQSFHLGIITVPLATALGISFIPADPSVSGALFWPMWVLITGLLFGVFTEVIRCGFAQLFRAQHLLMLAVVIIVCAEPLQPSYSSFSDYETVSKTFLSIGLFATMVALGSCFSAMRIPRAIGEFASRDYSTTLLFQVVLSGTAVTVFSFAFATDFSLSGIIDGLLAPRFAAPWSRGQLGGWDAFRDFLGYFAYIVPTFTVLLAIRKASWLQPSVVISTFCSLVTLAFLAQGGGRRIIVFVVGSAMLTWLHFQRRHLRNRHYILVTALLLANVIFLDVLLAQRRVGFREFSYAASDFRGMRVDDNFRSLSETLRVIPAEADFVGFQHLGYVLVRPVPRVFWPGKPVDSGFDLAKHLGQRGVSLSITAIGEAYMSFGWIGIAVGGLFFGWMAKTWSQLSDREYGLIGSALYAFGALDLFLGIRSLLELVLMTYPVLCWYVLDRILGRAESETYNRRTSGLMDPTG